MQLLDPDKDCGGFLSWWITEIRLAIVPDATQLSQRCLRGRARHNSDCADHHWLVGSGVYVRYGRSSHES